MHVSARSVDAMVGGRLSSREANEEKSGGGDKLGIPLWRIVYIDGTQHRR